MRNFIISIFLFCAFLKGIAQNASLGNVTIAQLEEKRHPKDSTSAAAILYSNIALNLSSNGNSQKTTTKKIKIYKSEGYYLSNIAIYFAAGKLSYVHIVSAFTYNLVDGKIVKTKLKPENEFIEKNNTSYWIKKIAFPEVKEGSIIEFQYTEEGGFSTLYNWNFQENIPVNYSELKTIFPDAFVFKKNLKGFFAPKITSKVANTYNYIATETSYVFQNLPAMKEEAFVNNIDNYRTGITIELERISVPGQFYKTLSSDWTSVAKTIYDFDSFGTELNKSGYFEEDLKVLLEGKTAANAKITAILEYVKSNVKWNQHAGYSCEKGVRKAYKEKIGNSADINLMLTAMLREAKLKANPVLISTRSNGIAFFPNLNAFNYVIAAVESGDEMILLDATDPFSAPNVLPLRDLNWIGRLIRKDGTSESIDLAPKKFAADNVAIDYTIEAGGRIKGKVRCQYTEHKAMDCRNNFEKTKEDAYLDDLENKYGKIEISDYSRSNEKDVLLPAVESFSFTSTNFCELIGDKIYIKPMLFFANTKNPFKQETREYPVDFGFPFLEKYNISIRIPEGYALETIPVGGVVAMDEDLGVFRYNIAVIDNTLQLLVSHQINSPIVSKEQYVILKDYYKEMIAKQTEKIVLKRI
ncbi:DUF3857 domain-containing protein [Flavobacterium sp. DG2-3]|uniref:DUF3857 domain-containing protein n=1 Tax=Flavobacterium sp. DG2-3 TaxID=3068317 RepID=UPI00273D4DAD|nr:DUF3857 domain-containing protein [Flavobacterium sp. DG2-3]MDP5197951.1 DUF3857 domain-containing protein [Flavobacterium sp. DG2-3]